MERRESFSAGRDRKGALDHFNEGSGSKFHPKAKLAASRERSTNAAKHDLRWSQIRQADLYYTSDNGSSTVLDSYQHVDEYD